jgi:chemotaxis protein MotB
MAVESKRRVIKKIDGGHGHHGGAWKVAYADFVTAMMALFMVLWLLASTDSQSRKEISQYFRTGILPDGDMSMKTAGQVTPSVIEAAPSPPPPGQESIDNSVVEVKRGLERMAEVDQELAEVIRNVHVQVTPEGLLIEAVDEDGKSLMFDSSSDKLKGPLQRFLKALAPVVSNLGKPVEINGHTDARPYAAGAGKSNWDLSYERASAARQILEEAGVEPSQIAGVLGRGSSHPYNPGNPLAAENRRLSILILDPHAPPPAKGAVPAKPADTGAEGEP